MRYRPYSEELKEDESVSWEAFREKEEMSAESILSCRFTST